MLHRHTKYTHNNEQRDTDTFANLQNAEKYTHLNGFILFIQTFIQLVYLRSTSLFINLDLCTRVNI